MTAAVPTAGTALSAPSRTLLVGGDRSLVFASAIALNAAQPQWNHVVRAAVASPALSTCVGDAGDEDVDAGEEDEGEAEDESEAGDADAVDAVERAEAAVVAKGAATEEDDGGGGGGDAIRSAPRHSTAARIAGIASDSARSNAEITVARARIQQQGAQRGERGRAGRAIGPKRAAGQC